MEQRHQEYGDERAVTIYVFPINGAVALQRLEIRLEALWGVG